MTDISNTLGNGIEADSRPAFMYDDDLAVDANDPIYQQVVAAMANDPRNAPVPGTEERPPEMKVGENGELIVEPTTPATPAAPETPPTADGVQIPAPDTGAPSSQVPPPAADDGEPAVEITMDYNGESITLGREQIDYLLQQNAWMQSIPDELRAQWAGVQDGTMVALTREEVAALQAAAANPTPAPAAPVAPDLTYADPEVVAYIETLKQAATPPAPAPAAIPSFDAAPSQTDMATAARVEAERTIRLQGDIAAATAAFTSEYQLTPEQANRLQQVTVGLGVVPSLSRERAVYSPTGALIREAPMQEVMKHAYEIAMNSDDELRRLRDDKVFNERLAAQQNANQTVNQKKALAGSLASAPSAAVPANTGAALKIGPGNQMNLGATAEAMAAFIAEQQASGAGV